MFRYLIQRTFSLAMILVGVSILVFLLMKLTPGDPILLILGEEATEADRVRLTALYGLDKPLPEQYFIWASRAVQGDLGDSIRFKQPVLKLIAERIPATMELAVWSLIIAIIIGIPVGVLAAVRRGSWIDITTMSVALFGVAAPNFWIGLILLAHVALNVDWIPVGSRGPAFSAAMNAIFTEFDFSVFWNHFRHMLLPAITLGTSIMSLIARLTRSSLLEVLGRDYVRTARAKGLKENNVIFRHALRNALLPVVTVVGVQFGALLGGSIVVEMVFSWPGAGRLIINAISQRDFPIVQGAILVLAGVFAVVNLLVDLSYSFINPRIRYA